MSLAGATRNRSLTFVQQRLQGVEALDQFRRLGNLDPGGSQCHECGRLVESDCAGLDRLQYRIWVGGRGHGLPAFWFEDGHYPVKQKFRTDWIAV